MFKLPKIKLVFEERHPAKHVKYNELHSAVSLSFARVREDTSRIFEWLDYLHSQNLNQHRTIHSLKRELSLAPKSHDDIKRVVDSYYSFDALVSRLEQLENKLFVLEQRNPEKNLQSQLQRKIIKKLTRNSKNYIKNTILSLISKYTKISALELREIIVDEQSLCSKSSFYRILEELESEQSVSVVAEGKEKIYFHQIQNSISRAENMG